MRFRQIYLMKTKCPRSELVAVQRLMENLRYFKFAYSKIYCIFPGKKDHENIVIHVHSNEGDVVFAPKTVDEYVDYEAEKLDAQQLGDNRFRLRVPIVSTSGDFSGLLVFELTEDRIPEDRGEIFENLLMMVEEDPDISEIFFQSLIPDGVIMYNNRGQAIFSNHVSALILRRLNIKPELVKTYNFTQLFQTLGKTETNPDIRVCTIHPVERRGFRISMLAVPIFHREKCIGSLLSICDVTSQAQYEEELQVKAPIIQEIHHRVKNNLQTITSLLRLQMRRDKSRPLVRALTQSINRIISIALIHEALSKEEMEMVNIKESLHDLLQVIISNMVEINKDIRGEIKGQDVFMTANQASNISLCVTEMVQNAIQHAFSYRSSGVIKITLEQVDNEVIICVEDNGNGISPSNVRRDSLGIQIIKTITRESLGGTFTIESHRYGTLGKIVLPKSS